MQERALPAKRAKLDEERRKLEEEETETASEGEGYFETVDKQRVNRGIQVNLEVECPHTMSLRILKSKCTTQKRKLSCSPIIQVSEVIVSSWNFSNSFYLVKREVN